MWLPGTVNGKRGLILQVLVPSVQADFGRALSPSPGSERTWRSGPNERSCVFLPRKNQSERESALFKRKSEAVNLLKL